MMEFKERPNFEGYFDTIRCGWAKQDASNIEYLADCAVTKPNDKGEFEFAVKIQAHDGVTLAEFDTIKETLNVKDFEWIAKAMEINKEFDVWDNPSYMEDIWDNIIDDTLSQDFDTFEGKYFKFEEINQKLGGDKKLSLDDLLKHAKERKAAIEQIHKDIKEKYKDDLVLPF